MEAPTLPERQLSVQVAMELVSLDLPERLHA